MGQGFQPGEASAFAETTAWVLELSHVLFQHADPTREITDMLCGDRRPQACRPNPSGPRWSRRASFDMQQAIDGPKQIAQIAEPTHRRPNRWTRSGASS
jgi:hypothetical protein